MNWKNYWNIKQQQNLLNQVQRTSKGTSISKKDIENVVENILNYISKNDNVLDICCGNGLITSQIECKSIIGVDFSKQLIQTANSNFSNKKKQFIEGDALQIDTLFNTKFHKIILNFSFQYFSFSKGKELILKMNKLLEKDGQIFISDIPNNKKQHILAGKGISKFKYYVKYYLNLEQTGKFWSKKELDSICNSLNLKGKFIKQDNQLPYAHYRFDYLITKN